MDYEEWMKEAAQIIEKEIQENQRFEVKELFPGHQWESLNGARKRGSGDIFLQL